MGRWVGVALVALLLAFGGTGATAQPEAGPVVVRWLEPGQLLLRWRLGEGADRILIGTCRTPAQASCVLATELRHRIAGTVQTATIWGQPGDTLYIWAYQTTGPNAYQPVGDPLPLTVPAYPTYLPVIR